MGEPGTDRLRNAMRALSVPAMDRRLVCHPALPEAHRTVIGQGPHGHGWVCHFQELDQPVNTVPEPVSQGRLLDMPTQRLARQPFARPLFNHRCDPTMYVPGMAEQIGHAPTGVARHGNSEAKFAGVNEVGGFFLDSMRQDRRRHTTKLSKAETAGASSAWARGSSAGRRQRERPGARTHHPSSRITLPVCVIPRFARNVEAQPARSVSSTSPGPQCTSATSVCSPPTSSTGTGRCARRSGPRATAADACRGACANTRPSGAATASGRVSMQDLARATGVREDAALRDGHRLLARCARAREAPARPGPHPAWSVTSMQSAAIAWAMALAGPAYSSSAIAFANSSARCRSPRQSPRCRRSACAAAPDRAHPTANHVGEGGRLIGLYRDLAREPIEQRV